MRPSKTTVDYFPHKTTSGRTMFVLENLYGNDGYAAWFKILEILGSTSGHAYDFSTEINFQYLCAKLRVSGEKTICILKTLAELGAIDQDLHSQSVIWSDNFCAGLDSLYQKRSTNRPKKPSLRRENLCASDVDTTKTPHSKGEYSKEKKELPCAKKEFAQEFEQESVQTYFSENPENQDQGSPDVPPQQPPAPPKQDPQPESASKFDLFWKSYPRKKSKIDAQKAWRQVKADSIASVIMAAVEAAKVSDPQWTKDGGQFIPYPASWLRAGGWEDEALISTSTARASPKGPCELCANSNLPACRNATQEHRENCKHFTEAKAA